MRALVTTLDPAAPMAIRDVPEPELAPNQALVGVKAFSLNRGELASIARNGVGWIPGQDIAGVVLKAAADGSGPPEQLPHLAPVALCPPPPTHTP